MKKANLLALLLALCLLLCACSQPGVSGQTDDPFVSGDQQTDIPDDGGAAVPDNGNSAQPVYPADLTVELVIEWAIADTLLSHLDDLSDQLHAALEEAGCPLDSVTLTINTAGGFTAQALLEGGIDAAILPALDIIPHEENAVILALSSEDIPEIAIAVSLAKETLSENFREILLTALTETGAGQDFLAACCGDAVFSIPTEDSLQAVRDYLRETEESGGGHA